MLQCSLATKRRPPKRHASSLQKRKRRARVARSKRSAAAPFRQTRTGEQDFIPP